MHAVVTIVIERPIVEKGPEAIHAEIERLMAPFNSNLDTEPHKVYLDERSIGHMVKEYGPDRSALIANMEDYQGYPGGQDSVGLYYMSTHNLEGEWDWYRVGGRYDGVINALEELKPAPGQDDIEFHYSTALETLQRNMCQVRKLPEDWTGYAILLPDGTWYERQEAYSQGIPFAPRDAYDAADKKCVAEWSSLSARLLGQYPNDYAVAVDYHN